MRLTRCFVPSPLQEQTQLLLPRRVALHLTRVLRLRPGAGLTLFDGRGGEFQAEILEVGRETVRVAVLTHRAIEREAPVSVTLLQSLARAERMDLVVQKATELGVTAIVPLSTEHSVVRLVDTAAARRCEHWRQVAISACEQCGRNRLPIVHEVMDLAGACAHAGAPALRWLLSPEADVSLAGALRASAAGASTAALEITLLIGPEGGWSAHDLAAARQFDFQPCHLGPRILRTETAPVAALALIQSLVGDLR